MATPSAETLCDGKANRGKKKARKSNKAIVKDEGQSLDQNNTDAQLVSNSPEGNVVVDKLIKDEVESTGRTKITTRSMKKLAEGKATIEKRKNKDGQEIFCQAKEDIGSSGNLAEVLDESQSKDQSIIDAGPTKNIAGKRTKKRKRNARTEAEPEVQRELDASSLAEENMTTKDAVQTGPTKMDIGNLKIEDETQSMCHTNLENGQAQSVITKRKTKKANVTNEKPKVKAGQTQMNENLADGKVITENPTDEAQSMKQNSMETPQPAEIAQEDVAGKRIKKGKNKKVKVNNEFHSEMDTKPENLSGVATLNKPEIKDAHESVVQTEMDTGSTDNDTKMDVPIRNPKVQDGIHSTDQAEMDRGPTENLAEGNMIVKRKKKRRKTKKAKVKNDFSGRTEAGSTEVPSRGLTQMDTGLIDNVAVENVTIENPKDEDEFQSIDKAKMDTGPTQNLSEGSVTVKRKKRRKRKKAAKIEDEISGRMDAGTTENLTEVNINIRIPESRDKVPSMGSTQTDIRSIHNVAEGNVTVENSKVQDEVQNTDQAKMDTGPTQSRATLTRKMRRQRKKAANVKDESGTMDAGSTKDLDEGIGHAEGRSAVPTCNAVTEGNVIVENSKVEDEVQRIDQAKMDTGSTQNRATLKRRMARRRKKAANVKDESGRIDAGSTKDLDERIGHAEGRSAVPTVSVGKKLLVLDINGLLADVVFPAPKNYQADIKFFGRAVFRRPFCHDFLKFCFQNFNVGIWSSRTKRVIDKVLSFILEDQKDNLLFVWDMTHCTKTGFKTLENHHKPLVCKELRKIWETDDPSCPWKKGDFNESNTLLIDDSPYKALLNPLHTAISPHPFQYTDENDNALGPGGDLRLYLEGVAASENVQKYVEQHPFGQSPIGEQDMSWEFYNRVLKQMSSVTTSQPMIVTPFVRIGTFPARKFATCERYSYGRCMMGLRSPAPRHVPTWFGTSLNGAFL